MKTRSRPHGRTLGFSLLATVLASASAIACGDDASAAPTTDGGETVSSDGSSTTTTTTTTTTDGSESSSSTGDGADTSTTADDGGSSESGGSEIACEIGETRLVGELDGTPIDEMPFGGGVSVSNLGLRIDIGDRGRVYMRADNLGVNMPANGPGYLRMPADGPLPEQWFCFDDGSSYGTLGEGSYFANLTGLSGLGTCPGEPVSGTVSVCFGADSCGGEDTFTSELEGATFTTPLGSTSSVGGPIGGSEVEVEHDLGDTDGGALYLHATEIDPDSTGPQQSAVDVVYFIVPLGEPDGGAIYCAELDATLDYQMERDFPEPLSAEIANISRLGTCADRPGDGHLDLCMNFGP